LDVWIASHRRSGLDRKLRCVGRIFGWRVFGRSSFPSRVFDNDWRFWSDGGVSITTATNDEHECQGGQERDWLNEGDKFHNIPLF